ncbi:GatB/YqeY domain-containing protein [Reichenbachiella carrageenanivorans]|uniref:GatB/YqeY domain-containing protein n=1 Tax=Reichenbachiella carrageenanivorans TaxID=2979869 RepID=A0ABY6D1Z9_9BACT|nr:GatB/YqeY domain-containing protein [Reichenbachiella carrageenanivorans]UXX80192.1 GatB/YqeY domain-containing protein [Reichenbachiella carrageenanivorans]
MSLKDQINADIKAAMLAKEKEKLTALRAIKSMILLAETEKGVSEEISEDTELKLLMKAAKQRKDSVDLFREQGRDDLADKEQGELDIISEYLPKQLSEDELKVALQKVIEQAGANGPQDMGKVMGLATKTLAGKADGKSISAMVKNLLT